MAFDNASYLVSNATFSASFNGAALNPVPQANGTVLPGGPMFAYEFAAYMFNGLGTANTANITTTNTTAGASTITFTIQEGSETAFTSIQNTNILIQKTITVGPTASLTLQALSLPVVMSQAYIRAIVVPTGGPTLSGLNIQLMSGRRIR